MIERDFTGKSEDEVISAALDILKLKRDQVEIKVENKGGFLGLGKKEVCVKISYDEDLSFANRSLMLVKDLLERMDKEIAPIAKWDCDEDENAGTFMGNFILFSPIDANLKLIAWDILGFEFTIENPGVIIHNGIEYNVQYLDLLQGKNGVQIEIAQN